ncbi:MAG: methyltransferase domain-containing protein [Lacunisphaera sp.]
MKRLREWWRDQQFEPGVAGLLVNPFYFARRGLRDGLGEFLPTLAGEVLDVGCGRKPYRHLTRATRYVGVDIDTPVTRALAAADFYYNGLTLPFPDASFDAVLCSQVLEHVFTPADFLREIHRVLRPAASCCWRRPSSGTSTSNRRISGAIPHSACRTCCSGRALRWRCSARPAPIFARSCNSPRVTCTR